MLQAKFQNILDTMAALDEKLSSLSKGVISQFFKPISIKVTFDSPEAGFLRLISFCYVLMHEDDSKINIQFIADKIESHAGIVNPFGNLKRLVHAIRTVEQHNIDTTKKEDQQKIYTYEDWLEATVAKTKDLLPTDWKTCCIVLINQVEIFLQSIEQMLDQIKEMSEEIIQIVLDDWSGKLTHIYPLYLYKNIAVIAAADFGYASLDVERFCGRYYQSWLSELAKHDELDFSDFARKQVEREFLADMKSMKLPIPIDGSDIIQFFNIKGGPLVAELINQAREIYFQSPCPKEQLLALLVLPPPFS